MGTPMDSADKHPKIWDKIKTEAVDFTEGLFHGSVENPVNGLVQFTNHLAGSDLPELHLVDEEKISETYGGLIGTSAGTALDIFAASAATAGVAGALSGATLATAALRFGAIGSLYGAVLQPSDANSKHFFQDRLAHGLLALGTYAAMGSTASLLDGTAMFGAATERSLLNYSIYGAAVGGAGGASHAEFNAILFKDQVVPEFKDLIKDIGYYGTTGGAMGAWSFGLNLASKSEFLSNATPLKNTNTATTGGEVTWQRPASYNGAPSVNHVVSSVVNTVLQTQTSGDSSRKGG
jgi:hypothetical protein